MKNLKIIKLWMKISNQISTSDQRCLFMESDMIQLVF